MSFVIGSWPLSGDFGQIQLEQIAETLRTCVENNLLEFDTAPNYGNGFIESCLGKELSKNPQIKINTKVGNRPYRGKSFATADLIASLDESLRRLAIDRVHILFLHNPRNEIHDYEPILEMFTSLKQAGKIQQSGISLAKHHPYPQELLTQFDAIQDDTNLLDLSAIKGMNAGSRPKFMARSPLASGILGGHVNAATQFAPDDHRSGWLKGDRLKSIIKRVDQIRQLSDLPLPELAYRFLLSHQQIDQVIAGVRKPDHVRQLARLKEAPPLNPQLENSLIELWKNDFGLVNEAALSY
ncbi:MAG: aldo/keto reductase [Pirellulaceae bacterium]|nr:aldo/keto reductase [Pirellulaceae bacterium]